MRAALLHGPGDIRVADVPDATLERSTDAVVRVVRTCVCGSDLHPYHSAAASERGAQIGHEFIGVVEDLGSDVDGLSRGDFVISPFAYADDTCETCRDGFQTACPHGGFFSAAQAEAVRVPQAAGTLVKVPGGLDGVDESLYPSLLTLSDVYLTGHHAAVMGRVTAGSTVAVIGDGAVGLSAVLSAQRLGAEQIILMGRHASRTDLGRAFGATDVVAERGEEGVARVMDLTGGRGVNAVLEAVGHMPAYEQAYGIVRAGGVISRVGLPQYEEAPVGFGSLFARNITLTGGPAPVRAYIDEALLEVLDGSLDPGRVFDRGYALDDVPAAYADMDARRTLKALVTP